MQNKNAVRNQDQTAAMAGSVVIGPAIRKVSAAARAHTLNQKAADYRQGAQIAGIGGDAK